MPDAWAPFLQLGTGGVVLLVLFLIVKTGDLRTKWELSTEQDRRKRAEDQVDTLIPAVRGLTDATNRQTDALANLLTEVRTVPRERGEQSVGRSP